MDENYANIDISDFFILLKKKTVFPQGKNGPRLYVQLIDLRA